MDTISKLKETENYIRLKTSIVPEVGIILGSGLGSLAESSSEDTAFTYNEVPYFAASTGPSPQAASMFPAQAGMNRLDIYIIVC